MASDWGCQVLLCLSDPRGPTTESECQPPIRKLWKHLAKGKSFPTCEIAGDAENGSGSFARPVFNYYDPCPEGTNPAAGYVAQGAEGDQIGWRQAKTELSAGGAPNRSDGLGGTTNVGRRACVAHRLGTFHTRFGSDEPSRIVQVYGRVVWQEPQNPRAIDVYIDGALHHRTRY